MAHGIKFAPRRSQVLGVDPGEQTLLVVGHRPASSRSPGSTCDRLGGTAVVRASLGFGLATVGGDVELAEALGAARTPAARRGPGCRVPPATPARPSRPAAPEVRPGAAGRPSPGSLAPSTGSSPRRPALLDQRLATLLKRRVAHAGSRQALACPDRRLVRGGRLVLMCRGRERPVPAGIGECWVAVVAHALRDGEGPLIRVFPPPSTAVCCGPGPLWHPAASIMLPITAAPRSMRGSDAGRRGPRLRKVGSFILLVLAPCPCGPLCRPWTGPASPATT